MSTGTARSRRWLRLAVGLAVSGAALTLLLTRIPLAEIASRLSRVRLEWILPTMAVRATLIVIRERRWRQVLAAMRPGPLAATWRASAAGYFGNFALPLRLGEVVRAGILRRANPDLGLADIAASIATERLLDSAVLAALVLPVLPHVAAPDWVRNGAGVLATVLLAATALAVSAPLHAWWVQRLPLGRLRTFVAAALEAASRGTRVLRRRRHLAATVAITVVIWLAEAAALWLGATALGAGLDYSAALLVTLLWAFGSLVPSAPAQIGTHQAMAVLFLAPFGVDQATAFSLSLVMQSVNLVVLGSIGGPALVVGLAGQRASATATISAASSGSSAPERLVAGDERLGERGHGGVGQRLEEVAFERLDGEPGGLELGAQGLPGVEAVVAERFVARSHRCEVGQHPHRDAEPAVQRRAVRHDHGDAAARGEPGHGAAQQGSRVVEVFEDARQHDGVEAFAGGRDEGLEQGLAQFDAARGDRRRRPARRCARGGSPSRRRRRRAGAARRARR